MCVLYVCFITCLQVAVSLGTPVMTKEWINTAWQKRNDTKTSATTETMVSILSD